MNNYTREQLLVLAKLTTEDLEEIEQRRRDHNRLGFAYQLAFIRVYNRFPIQRPSFEIDHELLIFVSLQLDISAGEIEHYHTRQPTLSRHQEELRLYLGLRRFDEETQAELEQFLFEEACRLEQMNALLARAGEFLREQGILQPAEDTLQRLIVTQRQAAREHIYERITDLLSEPFRVILDELLEGKGGALTPFQRLKQPPGQASPKSMLKLLRKMEQIEETGILAIDLSWLNNNYQRSLTRYAQRFSADRMRQFVPTRRYAVLVCFLWQTYRDTIDHMVDMHDKIMTGVYSRAENQVDEEMRKRRKVLQASLDSFHTIGRILLDEAVADQVLRAVIFNKVGRGLLDSQVETVSNYREGKLSHPFHLVQRRFYYLRQFTPALLEHIDCQAEDGARSSLVEAVDLQRELNATNKRKLPADVPLGFIKRSLRPLVEENGEVSKRAWECALFLSLRDEIRAGNIYIQGSKRFGRFDDFFMADAQWQTRQTAFFQRAGLPVKADDVPAYLTQRLDEAYDAFLEGLPENTYTSVDENGWHLSIDPSEKLGAGATQRLDDLQRWLGENLRVIKLPDLLIEVDNELQFTRQFMTPGQQGQREADYVCQILATIMAYGCNIGPYTMARLTDGVSYSEIRHITDWQLTEEAQRQALAQLVNAISNLAVTQAWGEGKTSSSDGQRFRLRRNVLQRTYSHRLSDYALEFYSFIADNYAPFYSTPIECTDRDAAYVLDGLLYNESDLALEEHYTDTHGYTEINFAAFAMLGRRFAPRIRGLHKQRIYRIDLNRDYGPLEVLLKRRDRIIRMDWICEQWERMGQFYASLESGHTTASTALKRLAGYSGKNHFYRANRELGRVFKTEYILQYMSDPLVRQRVRRGLLKGEELHALARQVAYGKQGKLTALDLQGQKNTSSCLTLIMACIIYWQAREINRVILDGQPEAAGVDLSLLEHISPIGWDNVLLYGEYVLNRNLVRP